ncbi:MAG: response regulator transcription factor [Vicinamibacterales bacterium]
MRNVAGTRHRFESRKLRILIVDDHPVTRKGLAQLINDEADMAVCGEADTVAGALALVKTRAPEVAIVDLSLGEGDASGMELIKALATAHPDVRVLVLSMYDEMLFAERALRAGATGYIMKRGAMRDLLHGVRRVAAGKPFVSEKVSERIFASVSGRHRPSGHDSPLERLTDREREVFMLIGRGFGTREIATRLNVSVKTIESHRARIKEKLGLRSAPELMRVAVSWAAP